MSIPIMPLNVLDIHDRHEYFTKKSSFGIGETVQKIIDSRPFGDHPFYIFAHSRSNPNNPFKKHILWQPRLSKPSCETNSMLFKVRPGSDEVRIIWMIPEEHLWPEYEKGKVCESGVIAESIQMFKKNRKALEDPETDDPSEAQMRAIYREQLQTQKSKENNFIKIMKP